MVFCRAMCMLTNSTVITSKSLLSLVRLQSNTVKNHRFFSIANAVFSGKGIN